MARSLKRIGNTKMQLKQNVHEIAKHSQVLTCAQNNIADSYTILGQPLKTRWKF